jgi:hypothetical protein
MTAENTMIQLGSELLPGHEKDLADYSKRCGDLSEATEECTLFES